MHNRDGFSNILIGILIALLVAVVGTTLFITTKSNNSLPSPIEQPTNLSPENRTIPTPTSIPAPAPTTLPSVPIATPPVVPTPAPALKSAPPPILVPAPSTQSQKPQPSPDIFVIQDDGSIIQPDNYINIFQLARKFYSLYPDKDNYDFLNVFTTFDGSYKVAFHLPVKNEIRGISIPITASTENVGSSRLLSINYLGYSYFLHPNLSQNDLKINFWVIGHEIAHYWLMHVGKGPEFGLSDGSHYTKWADTGFIRDGEQWDDLTGGWPWKDNGNGTVSVNNIKKQGFSSLSLYLMGLIPASEVPDIRVVVPNDLADAGFTNVEGKFKMIPINDIVAKYGARNPSYENAQKNFKIAYILLAKRGETPKQYQLDAINYIAQNFPGEWNFMTYGKSTINQ